MLDSVDVDVAVFCKKIYDCLRCAVCDKGGGGRLRFACGHTACTECANSSDCSLCFTNSQTSQPVVDDVLIARVENAGNLLTTYQDFFSVDVYKKEKLSQKLKIEKQLFPACIQAPFKYYNKRKSLCNSYKGKENQLLFSGEEVLLKNLKMDHKTNLVKKWLADNEQIQRKPLVDLNINQQRIINEKNTLIANNFPASKKRKKSTLNNLKSKRQKCINKVNTNQKKYFNHKGTFLGDEIEAHMNIQNENNPVQFDNEPIIIDDSQTGVVDKDKEAWLMVVEACKNELNEQRNESNKGWSEAIDMIVINPESNQYKVPFYKKSCLKDPCKICDEYISEKGLNSIKNNEVTIVVTNNSFVTTIKVSKEFNSFDKNVNKKSIEVQTDGIQIKTVQNNNGIYLNDKASLICSKVDQEILKNNLVETNTNNAAVIFNEDLFSEERPVIISKLKVTSDAQNIYNMDANSRNREHLIIDESDSDVSVPPNPIEVKVDIHKSCTEFDYGVLSEVRDEVEHSQKSRRPARELTPDSSNSSEKENFHPNKPKKAKRDKKNTHKK